MREIKFRVWDNIESEMLDWLLLSQTAWNKGRTGSLLYDTLVGRRSQFIPMQYIGLKDRHGKEIYMGDVVDVHIFGFNGNETEHEFRAVIEWCEEFSGAGLRVIENISSSLGKGGLNPIASIYGMHEESFTVIGNIYETPGLLEE